MPTHAKREFKAHGKMKFMYQWPWFPKQIMHFYIINFHGVYLSNLSHVFCQAGLSIQCNPKSDTANTVYTVWCLSSSFRHTCINRVKCIVMYGGIFLPRDSYLAISWQKYSTIVMHFFIFYDRTGKEFRRPHTSDKYISCTNAVWFKQQYKFCLICNVFIYFIIPHSSRTVCILPY